MAQTDNAPGVGDPGGASVKSDTHQHTAPVAVMQTLSTADSPAPANSLNLGASMLRTPNSAQPHVLHKSRSSTTDVKSPQRSPEPVASKDHLTESGGNRKRKLKDESMEEMMQSQTLNELFVDPNEAFAAPPKGRRTKLRRLDSTISPEFHAIMSDLSATFSLRLHQIQSEPDELPVAPQHLCCSSDGKVSPYNPAHDKKTFNISIDRPSYGKAIRIRESIGEFVLEGMASIDSTSFTRSGLTTRIVSSARNFARMLLRRKPQSTLARSVSLEIQVLGSRCF